MARRSNPCIITGCDLYDVAHDRWSHGDLFEYGDCYVFNGVVDKQAIPLWWSKPMTDKHIEAARYWERRGVFVIEKQDAQLNQAAIDYIGD